MTIRRYNQWAGNPAGSPEDVTRCIKEITPNERGGSAHSYQCRNKRGHGPEGLYCKTHNPEGLAVRLREERSNLSTRRYHAESDYRRARAEVLAKLRQFIRTLNYVPDDIQAAIDAFDIAEKEAQETNVQMWKVW